MQRIVAVLLLCVGIITFANSPLKYNYNYSLICAVLYGLVILCYFLIRPKKNYFDFDSLFFFTFFYVTLYYPVFLFETDPTRYVFFLFSFDKDVLPLSSGAALLAICSYCFGSLFFAKHIDDNVNQNPYVDTILNNKKFYWIALALFVGYFVTGGYFELRASYFGGKEEANAISKYLFLFCPAFLFAGIIGDFYNSSIISPTKFSFSNFSFASYISTGGIVIALIVAGSRTLPMQIILMIVGLYSLLYKNISFVKLLIYLFVGLGLMFTIVFLRGFNGIDDMSVADVVMDLVINNRNSFLAVDQVQREGYTYGVSMLSGIAAPIPFFQNLLLNSGIAEEQISSAKLFTYLTYGENYKFYGVGTNIVADIYLAFGSIGIVVLMCLLGYVINACRVNARRNIFYFTAYAIFISYAVYLVRSEYFFYMRYLLWSLLIIYLARKKFVYT